MSSPASATGGKKVPSGAEVVERLKAEVGVLSAGVERERKVRAAIEPAVIQNITQILLNSGARFGIIAAADKGLDIDLLYHFDLGGTLIVLQTSVAKEAPEIKSIAELTPAAEWAEKEVAELFGVNFRGHPKPSHFQLPDDWPAGNYPLGKPFKSKLPDEICPVAESITSVGATASLTPLMQRKREEAGLPAQPPASYSDEASLREVHELARHTEFDKLAGYDWEKKKLRGGK